MRTIKRLFGQALNALGVPGLVRPRACERRLGIPVEVQVGSLFTVVSVQNMRLLFHRVSGELDGVFVEDRDCADSAEHPAA